MKAHGATDIGLVRKINEDAFYFQENHKENEPFICIIADGMGGHNAGEIASKMAVSLMLDFFKKNISCQSYDAKSFALLLKEAFLYVNKIIYLDSIKNKEYFGMGTTLIVAFVSGSNIVVGHVGDSRVYFIGNRNIKKVTTDHSYVAELIKNGTIKPEEANKHPQKNLITRAIGTGITVDVDINIFNLDSEDYVILCTDGLSNMLEDNEIMETVYLEKELKEKCNELIRLANERGGHDNITAIIIEVDREGN